MNTISNSYEHYCPVLGQNVIMKKTRNLLKDHTDIECINKDICAKKSGGCKNRHLKGI